MCFVIGLTYALFPVWWGEVRRPTCPSTLAGVALVWLEPLRWGLERTVQATVDGSSWRKKARQMEMQDLAEERAAITGPKSGVTNYLWLKFLYPWDGILSYILIGKKIHSLSSICWDLREVETDKHFLNCLKTPQHLLAHAKYYQNMNPQTSVMRQRPLLPEGPIIPAKMGGDGHLPVESWRSQFSSYWIIFKVSI